MLKLNLDETSIVDSAGAVTDWNDVSGNGAHFTQATSGNRPTKSTLNGLSCIQCDGVDDFLARASAMSGIVTTAAGFMAGVAEPTGYSGSGANFWEAAAVIGETGGYLSLGPGYNSSGQKFNGGYGWAGSGKPANGVAVAFSSAKYYFELRWDSTTLYTRIDTTEISAAAGAITTLSGTMQIGRGYNAGSSNRYFAGKIGQLIACNAVPSSGQLSDIRAKFASKWGTTS